MSSLADLPPWPEALPAVPASTPNSPMIYPQAPRQEEGTLQAMERGTWDRMLMDAAEHFGDVFRRSLLDLDRQGEQWDERDVRRHLTYLAQRVWLSWDAYPPLGGRR